MVVNILSKPVSNIITVVNILSKPMNIIVMSVIDIQYEVIDVNAFMTKFCNFFLNLIKYYMRSDMCMEFMFD